MASERVPMPCGLKRGYLQDSMAGAQQGKCGEGADPNCGGKLNLLCFPTGQLVIQSCAAKSLGVQR